MWSYKGAWKLLVFSTAMLLASTSFALTVLPASGVSSFTIILQFDETGDAIDPCDDGLAACRHDADLTSIMSEAADRWEDIIEDDHTITIRYRWVDESLPSAEVTMTDANGRPTEAIIRIPAAANYFYDPTPNADDEFDMQPRLYRTTHPDEKLEAFQGSPLEIFEVGYNGLENDPLANDLLTIVMHEMGHSLGLAPTILDARPVAACDPEDDAYYHLDTALTGGATTNLKAFEFDDGFDCAHLALGGITACKTDPEQDATSQEPSTFPPLTVHECTAHQALMWVSQYPNSRALPSVADILSIAEASGWQLINLPRKYSLVEGPQIWADGDSWLGGRVPDAGDDVYIVNQDEQITMNSYEAGPVARNLVITSGNVLNLFSYEMNVEDRVTLLDEGTKPAVDLGATLDPFVIEMSEGTLLDVPFGGFVDSFYLTSNGEIRGAGSTIDVVVLENAGLIRGNGGLLTFTSSSIDDPFDLDASAVDAHLQALVGDLAFEGELTDSLLAEIEVGPNHFITFAQGWVQEVGFLDTHRLTLTGGDFEATINGLTELSGLLVINQIGRFTSDLELSPSATVELSLGGSTIPGAGHDQIVADQDVVFGGELIVDLLPAFAQQANDRYTLVTYSAFSGQFDFAMLPPLAGGLAFYLEYGESQLDLVVGFTGGEPGAPNCGGQVTSSQAQEHGGIAQAAAFHGYNSVKAFKAAIAEFCED